MRWLFQLIAQRGQLRTTAHLGLNSISLYISDCIDGDWSHLSLDLEPVISQHLHHFSQYNFLWKDDLNEVFKEFMKYEPGVITIENEVDLD